MNNNDNNKRNCDIDNRDNDNYDDSHEDNEDIESIYDKTMYKRLMTYSNNHPENSILWINPMLPDNERERLELDMFGKKYSELSEREKRAYQEATYDLEYTAEVYAHRNEF